MTKLKSKNMMANPGSFKHLNRTISYLVIALIMVVIFSQCSKSTMTSTTSILNQDKYKVWQLVDTAFLAQTLVIKNAPKKYDVLILKASKMKHRLKALEPKEEMKDNISYVQAEKPVILVDLPFTFGKFRTYRLENSSLFSPELANKFPDIRSYSGYQKDNKTVTLRMDVNPSGLFAMITSPSETIYIRPIENDYYICYKKSDVDEGNKDFYEPSKNKQ